MAVAGKHERLLIFCGRMTQAPRAATAEQAKTLMDSLLNAVEDEFSGVAFNPDGRGGDGRMYPAREDHRTMVSGAVGLRRYRHRSDETFIAANGAILIRSLRDGSVILDLSGADGHFVDHE